MSIKVRRALHRRPSIRLTTLSELLHLGKAYPLGYNYFRTRLHKAFASQAHLTREGDILQCLHRASFVKKGSASKTSQIMLKHAIEIEAL